MVGVIAFAVLTALWVAFAVGLLVAPGAVDAAWNTFRAMPGIVQVIGWILLLPVTLGVWIWETGWPVTVRAICVLGLAVATLYTFYPRPS